MKGGVLSLTSDLCGVLNVVCAPVLPVADVVEVPWRRQYSVVALARDVQHVLLPRRRTVGTRVLPHFYDGVQLHLSNVQ